VALVPAAPPHHDARRLRGGAPLAVGFAWFVWRVPADEIVLDRNADGIVVLTAERPGSSTPSNCSPPAGQRLLITGVNRGTTRRDLAQVRDFERVYACCVDLDHSAVNTSAMRSRRGAGRDRGFRSLIV